MKKLSVFLLALVLVLALAGCGCEHQWADANCVDPMTCTLCDKTEGEPLGHVWLAATCEAPKTCEVCAATTGEAKGHSMVEATCEEAKHCETCGLTEGDALGHIWLDATTEAPKTCQTCAATEGERIITDPRFTTASTKDLQGKWFMEVPLTGEAMGIEDFPGEAPVNFIMDFCNDGNVNISVEVTDGFIDAMVAYSVDMTYAEFAAQGVDKETADAAFQQTSGMTIQEYLKQEMEKVDFNAMYASLFEAAGLGGVYYVEDGLIYTGSNWDDEMEPSAYTLEGDSLTIDELSAAFGVEGTMTRMTEE